MLHRLQCLLLTLAACGVIAAAASTAQASTRATMMAFSGSNLGPIPDRPTSGCGEPAGAPRDVVFAVPAFSGLVVDVEVEIGFAPGHAWAGDVSAELIAPSNGPRHTLFGRVGATTASNCGDSSDLVGPYRFTDSVAPSAQGFWQAAAAAGAPAAIPAGRYSTTDSGGEGATNPMPATSLRARFQGLAHDRASGNWILRLTDSGSGETGTIASATLYLHVMPVQTTTIAGTGTGAIPDRPTSGCGDPAGAPLDIAFAVPALAGQLVDLDVEMTFSPMHTWGGDVTAVLIAPNGVAQHTLFGRVGATTETSCGDGSDLAGPYVFSDAASPPHGGLWEAFAVAGNPQQVASGSYFTTQAGGAGAVYPMPPTSLTDRFSGLSPAQVQGTWILRLTDSGNQDTGGIGSATLRLHHETRPPALYDNGPLATGNRTDSGQFAPAGYLWSELQIDPVNPAVANATAGHTAGATPTTVFRLADDFTVPDGQTWTLREAEFAVYLTYHTTPSSPVEHVSLQIWNGPPNDPGSELLCGNPVSNVLQSGRQLGLLRIFNSTISGTPPGNIRPLWALTTSIPSACAGEDFFGPGTYWLDWNSRAPGSAMHFAPAVTIPGMRGRAGDNALQWNGSEWQAVVDLGSPNTPPSVPQDFPFKLYGRIGGNDLIFANGFQ